MYLVPFLVARSGQLPPSRVTGLSSSSDTVALLHSELIGGKDNTGGQVFVCFQKPPPMPPRNSVLFPFPHSTVTEAERTCSGLRAAAPHEDVVDRDFDLH